MQQTHRDMENNNVTHNTTQPYGMAEQHDAVPRSTFLLVHPLDHLREREET